MGDFFTTLPKFKPNERRGKSVPDATFKCKIWKPLLKGRVLHIWEETETELHRLRETRVLSGCLGPEGDSRKLVPFLDDFWLHFSTIILVLRIGRRAAANHVDIQSTPHHRLPGWKEQIRKERRREIGRARTHFG